MNAYLDAVRNAELTPRLGRVVALAGQRIESHGPDVRIGELCAIGTSMDGQVQAEVVSVRAGRVILMPYGDVSHIGIGAPVTASGHRGQVAAGDALLGRVIDAFGTPLDGGAMPLATGVGQLAAAPINPLSRPRIDALMQTGVRAIDLFTPLGRGQRIGMFAGSGVGKSTLLGMLARNVQADINVIALIGERGREVREFVEHSLGEEGLRRSIVVVATSDQPAPARVRAALTATALAEHFRAAGKHVVLMMDSLTRFAMARREIGLAAGEPPTARGYTPSVFSDIPALCERCGNTAGGGSITALYTVLVEGDDFNEPISDIVRATLDGHIMLSRRLAHEGHFPAIDVLQSTSRLVSELASPDERKWMAEAVDVMATYERNRQMIELGAYKAGSHTAVERAIVLFPKLRELLRQGVDEAMPRAQSLVALRAALEESA